MIRDQLEHRETYLFIQYFEEANEVLLIQQITKHGANQIEVLYQCCMKMPFLADGLRY